MRIAVLLFCLFMPVTSFGQEAGWDYISGPAGDLTATLPKGFLVDNDKSAYRAYFRGADSSITINIERNVNPRTRLKDYRQFRVLPPESTYSQMEIGEFLGDVYISEKTGYSISFYLASKKGFYAITGSGPSSTDPILVNFFLSIRLNGTPLLTQSHPAVYSGIPRSLDKYESTPAIVQALRQPDAKNVKVTHAPKGDAVPLPEIKSTRIKGYSPLLVLRTPRAPYTSRARDRGVQGSVMLRVQLRGDGQVGDIHVLSGLSMGLTDMAVDAAKAIKFLPAQMDGKPVDREKTLEYTFSIY